MDIAHSLSHLSRTHSVHGMQGDLAKIQLSLDLAWEVCVIRTGLYRGSLSVYESLETSYIAPVSVETSGGTIQEGIVVKLTALVPDAIWWMYPSDPMAY